MKSSNAVKIGPDLIPCNTLEEAVTLWNEAREHMEAKHGETFAPKVTACIDKKLYRISYNGRAWDAGTGAEIPLFGRKTCAQHDTDGWKDCRPKPSLVEQIKPGAVLVYNDGRPGHTNARCVVLEVRRNGMTVSFEDRADITAIGFDEAAWMDCLSVAP